MSKRKYGPNAAASVMTAPRARNSMATAPAAAHTRTTTAIGMNAHGATKVEYAARISWRTVGVVQSIATPDRSSAPWLNSAYQYATGPPLNHTSGTAHTKAPANNP